MKKLSLLFSFIFIYCITFSQIINIPDDYPTIQQGINAALNGDTILVDIGTYIENINFNGKNVTVASLYLTTADTTYISQTIIDGDSLGSVVKFENEETESSVLCGLTLTNGYASRGGGIYCYQSNPTIHHVIVIDNASSNYGGGFYSYESEILLQDVMFSENSSEDGGGVAFRESNMTLQNVVITRNYADYNGGGIWCYESDAALEGVTVIYNSASGSYGGGIYNNRSSLSFNNSNRCNLYLNNANNGNDIYSSNNIELVVDTFTVIQPTEYHVYPLANFIFDITEKKVEQVSANLYVSPEGDNDNSGLNESEPLKNIFYALAKCLPDSINPLTIYLSDGVYSYSSNEEFFPINLPDYLSISGDSQEDVILNAEGTSLVLRIEDKSFNQVSKMTITGGNGSFAAGIGCYGSSPEFIDITITGNDASSYGGGMKCSDSDPLLRNVIISNNSGGGLRCDNSNPILENVLIANNLDGGICCFGSNPILKGVTIKENFCPSPYDEGGGLFLSNSFPVFDTIDRCNIFLNAALEGNDIYSNSFIEVIVDTFTVINPTEFNAAPLTSFTFDILNGKVEQLEADLYVSPIGDNDNSGLSPEEPLKNIHFALTKIIADSTHPHIIHLLEGTYSPTGSGDFFPISLLNHISLFGESKDGVVLDAEKKSIGIYIDGTSANTLNNMTIKRAGRGSIYYDGAISCLNTSPTLENLIICESNGGIDCSNANPMISDVNIFGNRNHGIKCSDNSNPVIENTIITDNLGFGICCLDSDPILKNIEISKNAGSGLLCQGESNPYLENVTITENMGDWSYGQEYGIGNAGGGIYIGNNSELVFDTINRCNIYLNRAIVGNDIYSESQLEVIVDTFTVLYPTEFHAAPAENISFDILHGMVEQVDADLYVSEDGDNNNDGLSEDDPLKTIHQAFLMMLTDSNNLNTVHILAGEYSPSTTGELFPLNIPDYYSLSGSSAEEVTLNAEGASEVISIEDNNYNWLSGMTITGSVNGTYGGIKCSYSNPILENLVITNNSAYVTYAGGYGGSGGGISCIYSNPIISNTIISNNSARSGGGLYCRESRPILENVVITNNSAGGGGGINCSSNSFLVLKNVTITKNEATHSGGGISCSYGSIAFDTLERCNIYQNAACFGNDIYSSSPIHVIVDTFTVQYPTNFHATMLDSITFDILYGKYEQISADLYVSPDGSETNSGLTANDPLQTIHRALSIIITDSLNPRTVNVLNGMYSPSATNEFFPIGIPDFLDLQGESRDSTILDAERQGGVIRISNNSSNMISGLTIQGGQSGSGGGIYMSNTSPIIENVNITDNYAFYGRSGFGGGIHCYNGSPVLQNVLITNNYSTVYGGGCFFSNSSPRLINVLILKNSYDGITCNSSTPIIINSTFLKPKTFSRTFLLRYGSHGTIINSIFSNNYGSSGIFLGADGSPSKVTISFSDIIGGKEGIEGSGTIQWLEGNIDEDPLFIGMGVFPYQLSDYSPCINAGSIDTNGLNLPMFDIAGDMRVFNNRIDMGAFEWNSLGEEEFEVKYEDYEVMVYPNPFTTSTTLSYDLQQPEKVSLTIYNQLGELVYQTQESQPQGNQQLIWNAEGLSDGIYYYRLKVGDAVANGKLVKVR